MSFPATRLSVVERTRSEDAEVRRVAWATIIEAYWKPVYKYLRMKWSLGPDEAADLTQEFFTAALEKDVVERYDPARDLGLTAATVTNHLAAMRRQFRQIILARLRALTASEDEFESEAARLLGTRK